MTYYESAEEIRIGHKRAMRLLQDHGAPAGDRDRNEFYAACGLRTSYDAQAVLGWLGY